MYCWSCGTRGPDGARFCVTCGTELKAPPEALSEARPQGHPQTAPILPSERGYRLDDRDVGRSARLDMRKALELTVESLKNSR
mgnify:CR=1 FL=1